MATRQILLSDRDGFNYDIGNPITDEQHRLLFEWKAEREVSDHFFNISLKQNQIFLDDDEVICNVVRLASYNAYIVAELFHLGYYESTTRAQCGFRDNFKFRQLYQHYYRYGVVREFVIGTEHNNRLKGLYKMQVQFKGKPLIDLNDLTWWDLRSME
jgi:uncharacterized protein YacL (UPF0231 family)